MLPRSNRLIKKRDFDKVYKQGKIIGSKFFLLRSLPTKLKSARIGFVISVRLNKSAVKRNQLKRQLRGIIRDELKYISVSNDIIISPRNISESYKFQELKEDLKQCLKKAHLL